MAETQAWVEPLLDLQDVPPALRAPGFSQIYRTSANHARLPRWLVVVCVAGIVAIVVALVMQAL